jgi:flagellar motor protein MotB
MIMRKIIKFKRLNPKKGSPRSCGERRPIDSNATPSGRALNRRVEIILKPRTLH